MNRDQMLVGLRKVTERQTKNRIPRGIHTINCQLEGDLHKKNNLLNVIWLCLEKYVSRDVTLTSRCIQCPQNNNDLVCFQTSSHQNGFSGERNGKHPLLIKR